MPINTGVNVSKAVGYAVITSPRLTVSKAVAYAVLNGGIAPTSGQRGNIDYDQTKITARDNATGTKFAMRDTSGTVGNLVKYGADGKTLVDSGVSSASAGSGVSSLNSLTGSLSIVAGSNITVTPSGSSITIDATSGTTVPTAISSGPDWPPASPGAMDDEFTAGSLGAAWTRVTSGSGTESLALSNSMLKLAQTTTGGDHFQYIYQPYSSTPLQITAKIATEFIDGNFFYGGLVFADSSSTKVVMFQIRNGGTMAVNYWSSPTSFSSTPATYSFNAMGRWVYMRVKDDGTNFIFSISSDGVQFVQLGTLSRTGFLSTPNRVGIGMGNNMTSGNSTYLTADFFRQG